MKKKRINTIKAFLLCAILLTLIFIFVQSMIPAEKSSEQSNIVGDIIEEIIPPETKPGEFVQTNLRKLAHFFEFAVLGAEVAVYVCLFMRKASIVSLSYITALTVALCDETIQIFSGRGPSVRDVWIDFSGFVFASAVIYAVAVIIFLMQRKTKKN